MADLPALRRKLITANHILHHHSVVDAYGHISVRHPANPAVYIMCGYMAPGVVSSSADLIEYYVSDGSTVHPNAKKGYSERFIHGEMYKKFANVNCVVHSHAEAVLPYVTSGVPLVPVFHMAGFLGPDVPVFDIAPLYQPGDQQDMLVNNVRFGESLASTFLNPDVTTTATPTHTVVLMRRHGYTTHGPDIETAVYRALYTATNASVQTSAINLRSNFAQALSSSSASAESGNGNGELKEKFAFEPLTPEQCVGCMVMNEGTQDKPWRLWVLEVESSGLYTNNG